MAALRTGPLSASKSFLRPSVVAGRVKTHRMHRGFEIRPGCSDVHPSKWQLKETPTLDMWETQCHKPTMTGDSLYSIMYYTCLYHKNCDLGDGQESSEYDNARQASSLLLLLNS